jgi:hypothetical protein
MPTISPPDSEIERYRTLLDMPTEFKNGFGWTTVAGIFFCGLVMMPGGIYLSLMTGVGIGLAAQWVTVILFMELSRRALRPLSRQNLVVLLHAAYLMLAASFLFPGGPMGEMVFRAYLAGSDAVRDAGMLGMFPKWFVPAYDSPAITQRNLFHPDWIEPISIALFIAFAGLVAKYTLGYVFFRITSDVERLPFPLAPIAAQGTMALAESEEPETTGLEQFDKKPLEGAKKSSNWGLFSLGTYIGIGFGVIQVGIPSVTGIFLAQPVYIIPQPFVDLTTNTQSFLPATPTGVSIDLAIVLIGFVLPYWAVIGTFIAILITLIANPILHHYGILQTWQPGMDTVNTTFANNVDFWLSFGIGSGIGIATVSIFSLVRDLRAKIGEVRREQREGTTQDLWAPPRAGRGDYPVWIAATLYAVISTALVLMMSFLLGWQLNLMLFLVLYIFLYIPFIAYVNARLLGIAGQSVDIPYVKELGFLASGAKGIDIWLAPVPTDNYGYQAQAFRVNELTGVTFWSLIKTELVALPVLFVLSLVFWGFIWHTTPVPSPIFPAAQVNWQLESKNRVLIYSSTSVDENGKRKPLSETEFGKALKPTYIGIGFLVITGSYVILSTLGLPVMLVYGLVRGFGQLPHYMLLEVVGALLGRYYFQKRFGQKNFLRMAPTLYAGYLTGVGLIGMATVALRLIYSAVSPTPF